MSRPVTSFDSVVLAAIARDVEGLLGGRVLRVGQPAAAEIALEFRARPQGATLLCSIDPRWARVHLATATGSSEPSAFCQMLRARLEGAKLIEVLQPPFERTLTLVFSAISGQLVLAVELMGRHSNIVLVREGIIAGSLKLVPRAKSSVREVLPGRSYTPPPRDRPTPADLSRDALSELLATSSEPLARRLSSALLGVSPTMATELATRASLNPQAPANTLPDAGSKLWLPIQELCARVLAKDFAPTLYYDGTDPVGYTAFPFAHLATLHALPVPRMSEAVERVVSRVSGQSRIEADRARLVQAVLAARARVEKTIGELRRALAEAEGAATLKERGDLLLTYAARVPAGAREVTLPGHDETPITIPLDPARSAVQNAQHLFKRFGKLKAARATLLQRLRAAEAEEAYLDALRVHIDQAMAADDLFDLRRELVEGGYLRARRAATRPSATARPRTLQLPEGGTLLVGRSNLENDYLTFKVADPDDLWFHARGVPGAHVILRLDGRPPTEGMIRRAAAVAAYFSQARGSAQVAVDYTERRHVRKPRGAKPGVVTYERERTIHTATKALDEEGREE